MLANSSDIRTVTNRKKVVTLVRVLLLLKSWPPLVSERLEPLLGSARGDSVIQMTGYGVVFFDLYQMGLLRRADRVRVGSTAMECATCRGLSGRGDHL